MKVADLSNETLAKIKTVRWDRIIEKHEGPETWESEFRYGEPEFIEIEGRWVLSCCALKLHISIPYQNSSNPLPLSPSPPLPLSPSPPLIP